MATSEEVKQVLTDLSFIFETEEDGAEYPEDIYVFTHPTLPLPLVAEVGFDHVDLRTAGERVGGGKWTQDEPYGLNIQISNISSVHIDFIHDMLTYATAQFVIIGDDDTGADEG